MSVPSDWIPPTAIMNAAAPSASDGASPQQQQPAQAIAGGSVSARGFRVLPGTRAEFRRHASRKARDLHLTLREKALAMFIADGDVNVVHGIAARMLMKHQLGGARLG